MSNTLQMGARAQALDSRDFSGWRSMDTAPRDGTPVEVKCTYGVAPWYDLVKWTDECISTDQDGNRVTFRSKPSWQSLKQPGHSVSSESSLHWRPYTGDAAAYVDPTGGMQNDSAYWRGAVASKYGLPLDYFEEQAAANAKRSAPAQASMQSSFATRYPMNPFPLAFACVMLFAGMFAIMAAMSLK